MSPSPHTLLTHHWGAHPAHHHQPVTMKASSFTHSQWLKQWLHNETLLDIGSVCWNSKVSWISEEPCCESYNGPIRPAQWEGQGGFTCVKFRIPCSISGFQVRNRVFLTPLSQHGWVHEAELKCTELSVPLLCCRCLSCICVNVHAPWRMMPWGCTVVKGMETMVVGQYKPSLLLCCSRTCNEPWWKQDNPERTVMINFN